VFDLYGLNFAHKHVPEMHLYSRLRTASDLHSAGRQFPPGHAWSTCRLFLDTLKAAWRDQAALQAHFRGSALVSVVDAKRCGSIRRY